MAAGDESVGSSSENSLRFVRNFDAIGLHSLLVIKNGSPFLGLPVSIRTGNAPNVNSVTKSFISTLYGIARSPEGRASGKVLVISRVQTDETDRRKLAMTEDTTMRTSQNWNETTSNMDNSFEQMLVSDNWLDFI